MIYKTGPSRRVRARAGCPRRRADLLRHDHQPRRRTRLRRQPARRDTPPGSTSDS